LRVEGGKRKERKDLCPLKEKERQYHTKEVPLNGKRTKEKKKRRERPSPEGKKRRKR